MKECTYCNHCYEDSADRCPEDGYALEQTLPGGCLIDEKYLLESCIGRGGMGSVYRAKHVHLNRPFAIKTILPEFADRDPQAAERFLQEARAAAAIQHPNIVAITDFGITKVNLFYYVMEHIEGKTLREEMRQKGALSPQRVYKIFKQMIAGIGAAHRLSMVHRDLKPSNIMLARLSSPVVGGKGDDFKLLIPLHDDPEETTNRDESDYELAKVVDFGLARFTNVSITKGAELQEGELVGSPLYMSPEQCDGLKVDERSDIYSLGVMLYQMLVGEVPFKGDNLSAILTGHLFKDPPPLRNINPQIPEKVEKFVLKMLAKKPILRHQSISEVADEFEDAMGIYTQPEGTTVTLTIQTIPASCEVYVDDEYKGRTGPQGRLVVKGLSVGAHKVRATFSGYLEWKNEFTAAAGDFRLEAILQRKEDADVNIAKQQALKGDAARRTNEAANKGNRDRAYEGESLHYRTLQSQPLEISLLDVILAILAIGLGGLMVATSQNIDPISAILTQRTGMPVEWLMRTLLILSVAGGNLVVIVADQVPAFRNSTPLSALFSTASLGFVVTVILPLVAAVPVKLGGSPLGPPIEWFALRVLIIGVSFVLQYHVRSKRKVAFLG